MANPYETPGSDIATKDGGRAFTYVGFWPRVGASIVDSILMVIVLVPIMMLFFDGASVTAFTSGSIITQYILPAIAVILFWIYKSATPGKMVVSAVIVDATTGGQPSKGQLIGRYFGYYLSGIFIGLGFLWVAFDKKKQGWHDKMAGTVVIRYTD